MDEPVSERRSVCAAAGWSASATAASAMPERTRFDVVMAGVVKGSCVAACAGCWLWWHNFDMPGPVNGLNTGGPSAITFRHPDLEAPVSEQA